MDYATFGLGSFYIILGAVEFWRFLRKSGIVATIERVKESIMVGLGTMYIFHSGLVEVLLGTGIATH